MPQRAYRDLYRLPNRLGAREASLHKQINQSGVDDAAFVCRQAAQTQKPVHIYKCGGLGIFLPGHAAQFANPVRKFPCRQAGNRQDCQQAI